MSQFDTVLLHILVKVAPTPACEHATLDNQRRQLVIRDRTVLGLAICVVEKNLDEDPVSCLARLRPIRIVNPLARYRALI